MPLPRSKIRDAAVCEGGEEAKGDILTFLTKIMSGTETEEELTVTLHETSKGARGRQIDTYLIGFDPEDVERKVDEIVEDAEREALALQGRIKFTVGIEGRTKSLVFPLDAPTPRGVDDDDEDDDDDLSDLETPTKRGMIQQAQRFAEHSHKEMRLAAKGSRELAKDQRIEMARLREENRELRESLRATLRLEQELHNIKHLRDLDLMKAEKSEQRKERFMDGVGKILPVLGGAALGIDPRLLSAMTAPPAPPPAAAAAPNSQPTVGESLREPRTPIEAAAERVLSGLDREQAEQLSAIIRADQFQDFLELHTLISARLDRDKARVAAAASVGHANGAAPKANGQSPAYGPSSHA